MPLRKAKRAVPELEYSPLEKQGATLGCAVHGKCPGGISEPNALLPRLHFTDSLEQPRSRQNVQLRSWAGENLAWKRDALFVGRVRQNFNIMPGLLEGVG